MSRINQAWRATCKSREDFKDCSYVTAAGQGCSHGSPRSSPSLPYRALHWSVHIDGANCCLGSVMGYLCEDCSVPVHPSLPCSAQGPKAPNEHPIITPCNELGCPQHPCSTQGCGEPPALPPGITAASLSTEQSHILPFYPQPEGDAFQRA